MNEILDCFTNAGIQPPPSIELDGKLHRFPHEAGDKKKSAWYIGFNNVANSGGSFVVMEYGSWKTGITEKYQSNGVKLDKHDKARLNDQLKKAKEEYEKQKAKAQEDTAKEAHEQFESAGCDFIENKYFAAKRIGSSGYDCRFTKGIGGVRCLVPMRDREDRIWGLQSIGEDGSKFFMSGQRVSGTFHTIGTHLKEAKEVYICEGFATGATIYEATRKTVVIAFNASNLVAVARALFEKYPDKAYVVCGDDDRFNDDKNPGRLYGTEAAESCVGKAIFPRFKNDDNKPTDFNDLFCREGIEAVRDQILTVKAEAHYITCLGYNENTYYICSNVNLQVQEMSSAILGTQMGLCRIQPKEYWEQLYPGERGGTRWGDAGSDLMQNCHDVGIFKSDSIRGPGAWIDQGQPIFHCGDRILRNGKYFPLNREFKSQYMYEYADTKAQLEAEPLSDAEAERFVDCLEKASWKRAEGGSILAAWLALAPVSGALDWRPHLWMTGPSGTGKSWMMEQICNKTLRGYATFVQGQSTEAGLRQHQRSSSLPIIFDEFETNDEYSSNRIKMILELARQASSDSAAVVLKGTASGDSIQFKPRFSMLVSSVRVNLVHEEDANRFTLLELERKENAADFKILENWAMERPADFGERLAKRTFLQLPTIIANTRILQQAIGKRFTMRMGQQWGALIAGLLSLIDPNRVLNEREASVFIEDQFVKKGVFGADPTHTDEQDEMKSRDWLLYSSVDVLINSNDRVKMPVLELIKRTQAGQNYSDQLQRLGVALDGEHVFVISNFEPLKNIYAKSKWSGGYAKALSRIPGAQSNQAKWFGIFKKTYKCVRLPLPIEE